MFEKLPLVSYYFFAAVCILWHLLYCILHSIHPMVVPCVSSNYRESTVCVLVCVGSDQRLVE